MVNDVPSICWLGKVEVDKLGRSTRMGWSDTRWCRSHKMSRHGPGGCSEPAQGLPHDPERGFVIETVFPGCLYFWKTPEQIGQRIGIGGIYAYAPSGAAKVGVQYRWGYQHAPVGHMGIPGQFSLGLAIAKAHARGDFAVFSKQVPFLCAHLPILVGGHPVSVSLHPPGKAVRALSSKDWTQRLQYVPLAGLQPVGLT
jgi:hypothetical protein